MNRWRTVGAGDTAGRGGTAGLVLALAATLQPAGAAPELPVEAYARLPQLQYVDLSPDGSWFAAVLNRGDDNAIVARPVAGDQPLRALLRNDNRESRLAWLHWVSNERLVVSIVYPGHRGTTDTSESRLLALNRDGSRRVTLVEPSGFGFGSVTQLQDHVVDWLPEDGHHILLQASVDRRDVSPAVYRVDIDTGEREIVQGRRHGVRRWISDRSHRIRVGVQQIGARVEILVRGSSGDDWRTAWSYEVFDRAAVTPLGFGADPDRLYVSADHDGHRSVYEVDLRDPALPRRLLLEGPGEHDLAGALVVDPASCKAIGIGGSSAGNSAIRYWDADAQALARAIDEALPDRFNRLLQFSTDGSHYLLLSSGNGVPGQFMLGSRAQREMTLIGRQYPELPPAALVRKQPLTIVARDGLALPAYLTLPDGAGAKNLPTVILPHGGPISMDTLDFDPLAEFLANRGYAVLQVNFRGSAGFGYEHMSGGLKRWGLEMQDDLADAVQWLVQRGTADAGRVCIVGASYGGYAALMGGAKTPDLYRCVVSLAGISDLRDLASYQAHYVNGRDVFERQVGSTWSDGRQLAETSPSHLAARYAAPVLLVHGTLDRTVPFEQSEKMAAALQAAGKSVRLVQLEGGDHALSLQAHRVQFYRELESFLAQSMTTH